VVPTLLDLIDLNTSAALAEAAMRTLQRYDVESIGSVVLARYPDQLRHVPALRIAALELLTTRHSWAEQLASALADKRIHPNDIPVHLVQKMAGYGDPALEPTLHRFWPYIRRHTPTEIEQKMADLRTLLRTGPGRIEPGKQVYQTYCGTCHRLNGTGGTIGPDLTGYERRNTEAMLRNVVDPNAAIREGYVQFQVQTKDNRLLTGLMINQQGHQVTLRSIGGQETTLLRTDILDMHPMLQSVMPERLLDALSDEQIRDLFAYLARG
jgi:putative heme-binding domain-containing protein